MTTTKMLSLEKVRQLDIAPAETSRPSYVYAASGLVELGNRFYIVADDELHLAVFEKDTKKLGSWIRLLPGALSLDYDQRKKEKPDLESIALLSPYEYAPDGALLMVPSMSRRNSTNGVLLTLNPDHEIIGEPLPIDFSDLLVKLKDMVKELNIEGAVFLQKTIKLFHRGSKGNSKSAVIDIEAAPFLKQLHDTHRPGADRILDMTEYDIGDIGGVPLQFTDAVKVSDDRVLFLATAEDTTNAIDDGASLGSAVGIIDAAGKIERVVRFDSREKLEGVSARIIDGTDKIKLMLVADTDNQEVPACLFQSLY